MTAASELDPMEAAINAVDYQRAGQVRQKLNERINAAAYGNTDLCRAIDRDLAMMGYTGPKEPVSKDEAPIGRVAPAQATIKSQASSAPAVGAATAPPAPTRAPAPAVSAPKTAGSSPG